MYFLLLKSQMNSLSFNQTLDTRGTSSLSYFLTYNRQVRFRYKNIFSDHYFRYWAGLTSSGTWQPAASSSLIILAQWLAWLTSSTATIWNQQHCTSHQLSQFVPCAWLWSRHCRCRPWLSSWSCTCWRWQRRRSRCICLEIIQIKQEIKVTTG